MQTLKPWLIELIWFLLTGVVVFLVILPIRLEIYGFPFERTNIYFIVVFITFLRWLLLLKTTPFHKIQAVKVIIGVAALWIMLYSIRQFGLFQNFLDEKGIQTITAHLSESRQIALAKYIPSEFIFFAIGSILVCLMMPFRMLVSVWRTYNLNKS